MTKLFDKFETDTDRAETKVFADRSLSVFQVMPRGMHFGAKKATSIDLCVKDFVSFSRFRATTRVFAAKTEDDFPNFDIVSFPHVKRATTFRRANFIAEAAKQERPDIIVVQQHLPTAVALAARIPWAKIVLHTHNFQKSYPTGNALNILRRAAKRHRYQKLAGIIHVSNACEKAFAKAWPAVAVPSCVVNNGLDFRSWMPAKQRSQEILFVGRCAPEKGVLEAAHAIAAILPRYPSWRARFILSHINTHPDCFKKVRDMLSGFGARISISVQRPFEEIKKATEHAAIALAPSIYLEAFGRTALEAHAGGAALISSGRGGLAEVSGKSALYLPAIRPEAIAAGIETLINDEMLRARLGFEGAKRVRARFDIRTQAARLDDFYQEIAQPRENMRSKDAQFSAARQLRAAE